MNLQLERMRVMSGKGRSTRIVKIKLKSLAYDGSKQMPFEAHFALMGDPTDDLTASSEGLMEYASTTLLFPEEKFWKLFDLAVKELERHAEERIFIGGGDDGNVRRGSSITSDRGKESGSSGQVQSKAPEDKEPSTKGDTEVPNPIQEKT